MNDAPRTEAVLGEGDLSGSYNRILNHARTLERELNAANKIIATAKEYVEEWKEFPMDDLLWRILGGK